VFPKKIKRRVLFFRLTIGPNEYFYKPRVPSASSTSDATVGGQTRKLFGHPNEFIVEQQRRRQAVVANESIDQSSSSMHNEGATVQSNSDSF
jgi:hypothetical protein